MAKHAKTMEEVIKLEIAHFNKTHKVPARLSDDCSQEIAIAIIKAFEKLDMSNPWYTMHIRNIAEHAGERFIKNEKEHESHFSHEKDDNTFLSECAVCRVHHMAVCSMLNNTIQTLLAETGFTDRECKIIMMVLSTSDGEMTFKEIGDNFGITANRARQVYVKILRKFRHPKRSKILMDYFDLL